VYNIPLHKEEHLASTEEDPRSSTTGPIFPKVLAQALSQRFQKPVAWRSAGVDGGSTLDIAEHLLSVVQDEVDKDQAPDLVVVLTGSNDLKHLLSGSGSAKCFRFNLMKLASQIQTISPKTKVVFPALPTYRMDQKSILNVFPLSVLLDSLKGVWDAQKLAVADQCPGVMHVDLKVADVCRWYQRADGEVAPVSLISADGIHPNARCYAKWGAFVGNSLADQILGEQHSQKVAYPQNNFVMKPGFQPIATYGGGFRAPSVFEAVKQQKQE
jgi:lysophospholipase L1-like esterase